MIGRTIPAAYCLCLALVFAFESNAAAQSALYSTSNWDNTSNTEAHISGFVFNDVNRNGVYDLGDRPMANVAVALGGADRSVLLRSNVSGFAIARASMTVTGVEISAPGSYLFRVIAPPGWELTTANSEQVIKIAQLDGSPGGLAAVQPAAPVGLAPRLVVSGNAPLSRKTTISGLGPNGETTNLTLPAGGAFTIPVSRGHWLVKLSDAISADRQYELTIDRAPVAISQSPANPSTMGSYIRFDDMLSFPGVVLIPNGYAGLDWDNWVISHNRTYNGEGYINGTVSGEYIAYNGSGHPAAIRSAHSFDFLGGYFSAAWSISEGENLHVRAWAGDKLKFKDTLRLSAMGPIRFDANYAGVTSVEFFTEHGWQFVADNLKVNFNK